MLLVLVGHVLKDLTIGTQNISRQGPHQHPLFQHLTRCLISSPRSPPREVVCRDVLNPHRRHRHSARSPKVPVEISHNNKLCPHWPLHHHYHHIPNRSVGKQCQVTVGPVALSCNFFYCPTMVIIVIVVVLFVNVVAVIVLRVGRPPNGPLSPCHPPNGKNTKAGV